MSSSLFSFRLAVLPALVSRSAQLTWSRAGWRATILAVALGAASVSPAFAAQTVTYQVKPGDTLYNIARAHQISVADLVAANGVVDPASLLIGQNLNLPVPAAAVAAVPAALASQATCSGFAIDDNGVVGRARTVCAAIAPIVATVPISPPPPVAPPAAPASVLLAAPYHSQFDGSAYAETNCGPTALSMALGALGISVDQLTLRGVANVALGTSDPNSGTTWASLAYAAQQKGAKVVGSSPGQAAWSVDDVKSQVRQGHPVLLLVRYQYLPGHTSSTFTNDHFIVVLGVDAGGSLIYNDPAYYNANGAGRTISPTDLTRAWANTAEGLVRTAMAFST